MRKSFKNLPSKILLTLTLISFSFGFAHTGEHTSQINDSRQRDVLAMISSLIFG